MSLVIVPNPHLQTPAYTLRRIRDDEKELPENTTGELPDGGSADHRRFEHRQPRQEAAGRGAAGAEHPGDIDRPHRAACPRRSRRWLRLPRRRRRLRPSRRRRGTVPWCGSGAGCSGPSHRRQPRRRNPRRPPSATGLPPREGAVRDRYRSGSGGGDRYRSRDGAGTVRGAITRGATAEARRWTRRPRPDGRPAPGRPGRDSRGGTAATARGATTQGATAVAAPRSHRAATHREANPHGWTARGAKARGATARGAIARGATASGPPIRRDGLISRRVAVNRGRAVSAPAGADDVGAAVGGTAAKAAPMARGRVMGLRPRRVPRRPAAIRRAVGLTRRSLRCPATSAESIGPNRHRAVEPIPRAEPSPPREPAADAKYVVWSAAPSEAPRPAADEH